MAREQPQERAVSWSDLPAGRRHRLAVLIGRMARRRLGTAPEAAETAHEPFLEAEGGDTAEQDPRRPPRARARRLCPAVAPPATRPPRRAAPGPVRPRGPGLPARMGPPAGDRHRRRP